MFSKLLVIVVLPMSMSLVSFGTKSCINLTLCRNCDSKHDTLPCGAETRTKQHLVTRADPR